jgi:inorganic pyrophosphatase
MKHLALAALLVLPLSSLRPLHQDTVRYERSDEYTLAADRHLVDDFPARTEDGHVRVVVEIPAGTTAKWEVDKADGALRWELRDGRPRVVEYLGYPGNYGMVPRTLLPKSAGGDGDPLDVIVLGPAVERGAIVHARLVGVLELLDGGEQDDKLLAVQEGTALAAARSLAELDAKFHGVTTIVETWFTSYKGPGELESRGFGDVADANAILETAIAAWEEEAATAR